MFLTGGANRDQIRSRRDNCSRAIEVGRTAWSKEEVAVRRLGEAPST